MVYIIVGLFAAVMGAGAVCVVFHGGEKEGICKYDYMEDQENNGND